MESRDCVLFSFQFLPTSHRTFTKFFQVDSLVVRSLAISFFFFFTQTTKIVQLWAVKFVWLESFFYHEISGPWSGAMCESKFQPKNFVPYEQHLVITKELLLRCIASSFPFKIYFFYYCQGIKILHHFSLISHFICFLNAFRGTESTTIS